MKVTITDFGAYIEELCEPDDPPDNSNGAKTDGQGAGANGASAGTGVADPWPTLDTAAYYGLVGRVVATILPHTESDPAALLLQYLVSFGSAVGRQPFYLVEGAEHYPNVYVLVVGDTAKARKGTSAQHIRRIMQVADPGWARTNVVSGISSGEGIIHAIRDPVFTLRKGQEEMTDAGVEDKRLLIDEREFSSALDSMKREGNVVRRIIRDAWDDPEVLRTLTKHSPTRATRPFISIAGHITVEELRLKLDQSAMADGFGNRFLYACARRSKLLPHGGSLDENAIGLLGAATLEALTTVRTLTRITMTPEAAQRWEHVYPRLSEGAPGLLGKITARAEAQTVRLALLYALLDRSPHIERVHLEAALALWAYCEASARFIFGDLTGNPIADTILRALRSAGVAGLSRWDITNNVFGRNVPANKIAEALMQLLIAGKNRREMQAARSGCGRPREVWFVV